MDPVTLAVLTSAATVLASEAAKGVAGEAGKDVWNKIKAVLGFKSEPAPKELATSIARRIHENPTIAAEVASPLRSHNAASAAAIVGSITADKVVVAGRIDTVNM